MQLQLRTGLVIPLLRTSNGTYAGYAPAEELLFGYRTADLHNAAGFIEVISSNAQAEQTTILVNVKDAVVPSTSIQQISGIGQVASHVVNLRYDSVYAGGLVPPEVLRTFYQEFGDDYDFVNVLEQVHSRNDFSYFAVRNDALGLGLQMFSRGATYGSAAGLEGILNFPVDAAFDPAETSIIHELAHRWLAFSNLASLRDARPHFPISTLAFGITGLNEPGTNRPLIFRYVLTPLANGTYRVNTVPDRPRVFNDLELYLMGLTPADSVGPHLVFENQSQMNELRNNGILSGPADTITVAEWIAREARRIPTYPNTQRAFRMATIVLSRGGLLSADEMSFYNHMAARGEAETDLQYVAGTTRGTTLPFYLATGRRGTLSTRLVR